VNNKPLRKVLPYVIFALSVVATLMLFLPALAYEDLVVTGREIAFGTTIAQFDFFDVEVASARLPMNMYAIVAFLAPLLGGILTVVFKKGQAFSLAMFAVAAVLLFMLNDYIQIEITPPFGESFLLDVEWDNRYGLLIAAFASILAAIGEMLHISLTER